MTGFKRSGNKPFNQNRGYFGCNLKKRLPHLPYKRRFPGDWTQNTLFATPFCGLPVECMGALDNFEVV